MGSLNKRRLQALVMLLALWQTGAQASAYVDVLDLPARLSALAVRSPMLDVANAGPRLVAVGQRGHILYSDDAGKQWSQASVPVSSDLNAVYFSSREQGWAVGNDGVILHSSDAGVTWKKQLDGREIGALLVKHYSKLAGAEPANEQWPLLVAEGQRLEEEGADKPLLDVWFADDKLGYAVGVFNLILRTEDGGQSWTPFQDRTDNPQNFHLNAINSTGDALYIAGEQGLLLKWDSSQQRFAALQTPYQGSFFGVVGKPGEVVVYGLRGNVFRSTDGGLSWSPLESGLQVSITAAAVDAQGHYRFFTQAGHMLLAKDDSVRLQWVAQQSPSPVAGATAVGEGALVVVGSRGARTLLEEQEPEQ
ncbi:YCF48-related protein [Pseudomonas sp. YuFO20]|uniref:WD40/YVTN/BNR-like repeat-containing protein n=1 Tax=Pseudomonas sp. YuFO20 TaxID=3095362 RepID=UPI002B252EE3|nr:YCF48-related protein [Pseudomonas sp. YuFO20]MEB2518703.1 YCF48-related protein [Pseudomonas sp. YuFO20]